MKLRHSVYAVPVLIAAATFAGLQFFNRAPASAVQPKQGLRIATYNIEWLNENIPAERRANLQSVLRNLDADVIGLQEVQNRKTLELLFGSDWEIAIFDEPSENQEVALAVRRPLRLLGEPSAVFPDANLDFAFPGKRDVLRAVVRTPGGMDIAFYVVHMKSRSGGRATTDRQRIMASSLLAAYIRGIGDEHVVVLGDFNDTPDDASVRILETGDLLAEGGKHPESGRFLVNVTRPLHEADFVTFGMDRLYRGNGVAPQVKGARDENLRLLGQDYRYPDDLVIIQAMFDQILVSRSLAEVQAGPAGIYASADALRGSGGQTRREDSGYVSYQRQGTLASDHLPVYADFRIALGWERP